MKILIVAATEEEIDPFSALLRRDWSFDETGIFRKGNITIDVLITGIGMMRTAYALGKVLNVSKPDLCINAGIAGAFPGKFEIGNVVHVVKESIPELGAIDSNGKHLTLSEMGLKEDISSTEGFVNSEAGAFDFLPRANGITVNTVHGDVKGITQIQKNYDPDIESMESAAFFYCCIKESVPFIAIRAVSNIVEPRDRSKWDIPLAIKNLNGQLMELIDYLSS